MTFIKPINVLTIQDELKRYRELCLMYQHKPVRDEFTFDKLIEIKKEGGWSDTPDPTK